MLFDVVRRGQRPMGVCRGRQTPLGVHRLPAVPGTTVGATHLAVVGGSGVEQLGSFGKAGVGSAAGAVVARSVVLDGPLAARNLVPAGIYCPLGRIDEKGVWRRRVRWLKSNRIQAFLAGQPAHTDAYPYADDQEHGSRRSNNADEDVGVVCVLAARHQRMVERQQ